MSCVSTALSPSEGPSPSRRLQNSPTAFRLQTASTTRFDGLCIDRGSPRIAVVVGNRYRSSTFRRPVFAVSIRETAPQRATVAFACS